MKKTTKKSLLLLSLVVLCTCFTAGAYVYWASGVGPGTGNQNITIDIGEGETVSTTVALGTYSSDGVDKKLVPSGRDTAADDVTSVAITFSVRWNSTNPEAYGTAGTISYVKSSVTIDGDVYTATTKNGNALDVAGTTADDLAIFALFNTSALSVTAITCGNGTQAATTTVCTITLTEPANEAQYDIIAGKTVSIAFAFTATAD